MAAQEVGEAGNFAAGDLGGAEALFHEFKGGVTEWGEGGFGAEFDGVALEELIEIDGGGEGALEGGDAVSGRWQGFAG